MVKDTERELQLPGCRIRLHAWTALLALIQAGAALHALQVPRDIQEKVALSGTLEAIAALLWVILFLIATVVLLYYGPFARRFAVSVLILFVCYNLVRWIAFTQADYDRERLPALIIGSMVVIFVLVASLISLRRLQFKRTETTADDTQPEN